VSIEAGVTFGWQKFVGPTGRSIGVDAFGSSAPGNVIMEKRGITAAAVAAAARSM
jgi:transketolase